MFFKMVNIFWVALLIAAYCVNELYSIKSTTLNVRQRIAVLRQQIENEIRSKQDEHLPIEEDSSFEENEYDHDRPLLTPINKKKKKTTHTEIMTASTDKYVRILTETTTVDDTSSYSQSYSKEVNSSNDVAKNISAGLNKFSIRKPMEIFYRRMIDEYKMNTEVQWVHCQDMITPFIKGIQKELTHQNHLTPNSPVVTRFIHLITLNTTLYTKEDIFSVLYQLSNLQLRLFQWDIPAINMLFNILMKERDHTFSNLKWGIRNHFAEWRLDISNTTNLLQQTRLFRPPCLRVSDSTGSTKSNKLSSAYLRKSTPSGNCGSSEGVKCKKNPA